MRRSEETTGIYWLKQYQGWKIKVKDERGKDKWIPLCKAEFTPEIPERALQLAKPILAKYRPQTVSSGLENLTLAEMFAIHKRRFQGTESSHRLLDLSWRHFESFASKHGWTKVKEVRRREINLFIDDLLARVKPTSARAYMSMISSCFSTAIADDDDGVLGSNPCTVPMKRLPNPASPEMRKKIKFYNPDQQKRLWEAIETDMAKGKFNPDYRDLVRLMYLIGTRVTATTRLEFEDVVGDGDFVNIRPLDGNKTDGYKAYLVQEAREIIARRKLTLKSGRIFPTIRTRAQCYDRLKWLIRRHPELKDIQEMGRFNHTHRHTCGTNLSCKVPLEVVRDQLGHGDITTTQIYAQTTEDKIREAFRRIG